MVKTKTKNKENQCECVLCTLDRARNGQETLWTMIKLLSFVELFYHKVSWKLENIKLAHLPLSLWLTHWTQRPPLNLHDILDLDINFDLKIQLL